MPARSRRTLTLPPDDDGARARTHRRLLASAMQLVRRGRTPSVAEVALTAGVSRATAYRYFPNRSTVIAAVVAESLGPVRSYVPRARDGGQRVRELFSQTFPRFKEFEPHMRAALQLSLEHESLERVGLLEEPRYRRGFRRDLLRRAAAPLRKVLGRRRFDQLLKALSMVYGIEPYVVLKDIWDSNDREVEEIARWMVDALIDAALRDASAKAVTTPRRDAMRTAKPDGQYRRAKNAHRDPGLSA
jgi:AcrR family transcriptional regulator